MNEQTRILIVDDHPVVRKGLRDILAVYPTTTVVGEAGDGHAAVELSREVSPDVVLLDVRLQGSVGVRFVRPFKDACPDVKVIMLTTFEDDEYLFGALREGADGYLLKTITADELVAAIAAVRSGDRLVSSGLSTKVLDRVSVLEQTNLVHQSGLSENDLRILKMIADGNTTREIAETVFLSEITIKRRVSEILEKLGARHRAQAVSEAMRRGLL